MGEILDVGTEAQTCLMAGRGMNGLRGTIVCYNASNQRYTIELDSGDMLSLKARNVEAYVEEEFGGEVEEETFRQEDVPVKGVKVKGSTTVQADPSTTKTKKPSSLPKYSGKTDDDERNDLDQAKDANGDHRGNIVDRFLYVVAGAFIDMSPSVFLLTIMAAYYANRFFNGGSSGSHSSNTGTENDTTKDKDNTSTHPKTEYDVYHDGYYYGRGYRSYYWWGGPWHGHDWYYWGWYGASGIFSVLVVGFFIWQFGTRKGRTAFSWPNVKTHVQDFDYWDVMRYAALLQGATFFITRIVQNGGRRR